MTDVKAIRIAMLFLGSSAMAYAGAEVTFDEAVKKAAADYGERMQKASDELNAARIRIADEKAPILRDLRSAEDRIVASQSQIELLETDHEQSAEKTRKLISDIEAIRKNASYVSSLAHDGLKAYEDSLAPGEGPLYSDRMASLDHGLDDALSNPGAKAGMDVADFLLERVRQSLGGYIAEGSSLTDGDNRLRKGTFAFVGPETYFLPSDGGRAGTVRSREGSSYPITYALGEWAPGDSTAFFQGARADVPADPSGGKALRMKETSGTILEHIEKGGVVAYAIIAVGILSLLMILQKIRDLSLLSVESSRKLLPFLALVAEGDVVQARNNLGGIRSSTRKLLEVGLQHQDKPKTILEEHLQSELLRQRLRFERRLPLLAVIATAAPLMGLLGTVVGMVKTFALITVFGTGNAGKLASGISQVLVTTELGLVVAIPTLIAHGFLSNRLQKNLAILERQALDFVIAVETSRISEAPTPL